MATDIYYSCSPFGTGNLLSGGSPTIVVDASGNATLTLGGATLVDNIGQGVAVQYNGITSFIDSITSTTSFHLVTALGANAASQTSTAVTSINHEYASLNALEAGFTDANHANTTNLVTSDYIINAACYYDHDDQTPDSSSVVIEFGTSDATRYFRAYTPNGGTESINIQRSETGNFDSNKFLMEQNSSATNGILKISGTTNQQHGTRIEGLQIHNTNDASANARNIVCTNATTDLQVNYCILNSGQEGNGIFLNNGSIEIVIRNSCIFHPGTQGIGSEGVYFDSVSTGELYNCTVYNFNDGVERDAGTVTVTNCAVFNNTDDFDGIMTISYCASDDGDGTNAQTLDATSNYANEFTDVTTGDFSLVSGGVCEDNGTDLSGSGVTDDIIGTSRPQGSAYDISCFELVAAADEPEIVQPLPYTIVRMKGRYI